ncbi:hypothetical protein [Parasitella parasitica]|uniref:Uncharacterized protein n=1 Tax=Parasitella parasitica TaxID=35722 RepID=A0A0B7N8P4_9FUNG|nr:hypothetical protein [Parasitella parasitica]
MLPSRTFLKSEKAIKQVDIGHEHNPPQRKTKASILPAAAPNFQQDLDAPGPSTSPSYSTAVSTPADDFDVILSAMSPEEVEDFFSTFQDPVPSLNLAKSASSSGPSNFEAA